MLAFMIYIKSRTVDLDSPGDENEGNSYVLIQNYVYERIKFLNLKLQFYSELFYLYEKICLWAKPEERIIFITDCLY